jgi:hypothetical protein
MEPGSEPGPSAKQAPPQVRLVALNYLDNNQASQILYAATLMVLQAHLAAGPMAQLTVGRVKSMIKEDAEVKSISTEACFVVAKATVRSNCKPPNGQQLLLRPPT